jgi:AraC-like DNA-binding protein
MASPEIEPAAALPNRDRGVVAEGSLRVGPLMALPQVLDEFGADTDAILAAEGWQRADFADPESVIPIHVVGRTLRRGREATGCGHLGLLIGQRMSLSSLGALGFLMQSSPTVADALRALGRHLHVHDRAAVVTVEVHGSWCRLGYLITVPDVEVTDQLYTVAALAGLHIMQALCGPRWRAQEVCLPFEPPHDAASLRQALAAPLSFGAQRMELLFAAADLERPLATADALLHRMMSERIAELETMVARSLPDEVRRLLRTLVFSATCTPRVVGLRLGLPLRTLNRRLAEQGTSVSALRDEVRRDTAYHLLAQGGKSAGEVGRLLGYAEPAAFSHAFRRWTGMAPARWRAQHSVTGREPCRRDEGAMCRPASDRPGGVLRVQSLRHPPAERAALPYLTTFTACPGCGSAPPA